MRRLPQLCSWMCSFTLKPLRRRLLFVLICALVGMLIFKWKLLCNNTDLQQHIKAICNKFATGETHGNLCQGLCQPEVVASLTCHHFRENQAVFSGTWKNYSVIYKSVEETPMVLKNGLHVSNRFFLSEDLYYNMVKTTIKSKFNVSVEDFDIKEMLNYQYNSIWPKRYIELKNIWSLLQDNEYLALTLYKKFDIFPKLLGNCGSIYAVQQLSSISRYWHLMTLYDTQEEWEKRIKMSLMILDLILHLEKGLPEPLLICDVNLNNFGFTDDFKKTMFLNLNSVHPLSIASKITGDGSDCKQHSDCDLLDCRSFCNLITFKCQHGVVNNNLQIVCERIFLGWMMSGKVMVPGLLLGPRTPRVLIEILEQCANPASESGMPRAPATKEIRKRLYNILVHLKSS